MDCDISHPLLAQAFDESNAGTFDEVIERALYLYVVLDNPEEALKAEQYYNIPSGSTVADSTEDGQ